MSVGPIRRSVAIIGLLALIPIAWQLVAGGLDAEQAALRAVIVAVVVFALGKVASLVVTRMLYRVERRASDRRDDHDEFEPETMGTGQRAQ